MKYKDWLKEWLENYVQPSSKQKTYVLYGNIVDKHINPELGKYELADLNPFVLQCHVTEALKIGNLKSGAGLSANSVNSIITVIQSSLKIACDLGYVKEYFGDKIKRPKAQERRVECFSVEEQKSIETYIINKQNDKLLGIILCLYTGLRIGELLALEWDDINLSKAELSVSKTCYDGIDVNGIFSRITSTPKTSSSVRIIPIPIQMISMLRKAKKNSHSKYVISKGEKYILIRSYQRTFEKILKKLNISHRGFHSLRHTFATRALECGMDVKTLSEILGHKSPTVTLNRYAHSFMKHKKDMMNKLGKLL